MQYEEAWDMYDRDMEETRRMKQRGHRPEKALVPCTKVDRAEHSDDQREEVDGAETSQEKGNILAPQIQPRREWMERTTEIPDMANQNQQYVLYATSARRRKGDYMDAMEQEISKAANTEDDCSMIGMACTQLNEEMVSKWRDNFDKGIVAAVMIATPT
eukprot:7723190-Pyramimonas_sp.AAC.1